MQEQLPRSCYRGAITEEQISFGQIPSTYIHVSNLEDDDLSGDVNMINTKYLFNRK